jgi:hypothetical protein
LQFSLCGRRLLLPVSAGKENDNDNELEENLQAGRNEPELRLGILVSEE